MQIGENILNMQTEENILLTDKNILVSVGEYDVNYMENTYDDFEYLKNNFCGQVFTNCVDLFSKLKNPTDECLVYLCGDLSEFNLELIVSLTPNIKIISGLTYGYNNLEKSCEIIKLGQAPININGVGIYFRQFFDQSNIFESICLEHEFQTLTESNKPTNAFRTGIYITKVESDKFNLLRCSSNFSGPTDNLELTDQMILDQVNGILKYYYSSQTNLNHILAQIYTNRKEDGEDKKARIKEHSDKTKDMPKNGLMAFCSFYQQVAKNSVKQSILTDSFDYVYNGATSVLTKMRFKLKKDVLLPNLTKQFDITLYPNSVFVMSLEMNRLYTHEIIPSILPVELIPTRMGYVIRCSKTQAIHKDGCTWLIDSNNNLTLLEEPNPESIAKLKELYYKENITSEHIEYNEYNEFNFSLNKGDYMPPSSTRSILNFINENII